MTTPITFGIVGGGWRTQFFLQAARQLPERFRVSGMFVRNSEQGRKLEQQWHVPFHGSLDELLRLDRPQFVVVSVPRAVAPAYLKELAERTMPTLVETPPAPDLAGLLDLLPLLRAGAKIQVAEQYHLQPLHVARLALAYSGKLGSITQAQVSIAHDYHGISLMRKFLGIGFENATIRARSFSSPLIAGPGRGGQVPDPERIEPSRQVIAELDFGERLGIYDFSGDQYHSWIRSPRLLVRGERGEINNTQVSYLADVHTPINFSLQRENAGETGNLEGHYLKGITGGGAWLYRNPFIPGRLSDDEIAVAACLEGMARYAEGGPDFYSVAEAAQDYYLALLIAQAATTGEKVISESQPWSALSR